MRFFASLFAFVLFIGLSMCFLGYRVADMYQSPSKLSEDTYVIVEKGEGVIQVSKKLANKNVIDYPLIIKFFAYYQDVHTKIKAGEYALNAHISPQSALEKMVAGDTVKHKLTVIEGKTVYDTLQKMTKNDILSGDITITPQEGTLLPETYIFERGTKRDDLIRQIQGEQAKFLQQHWTARTTDLPIASPEDALTLASIVEKETGLASERAIIASVFINRLRMGMRLQSDPTIIYNITQGKGTLNRTLYRSDILNNANGYNTYVINALPPTPICNPSKEAILAVLNPADTDYLYFVANGTGGHIFSKNLEGHNDNVQKWREIEKNQKQGTQNTPEIPEIVTPPKAPIDKNIPIINKQSLDIIK
jgi:UPF0755 protein